MGPGGAGINSFLLQSSGDERGPLVPGIQWQYNFWDCQHDLVVQGIMSNRATCNPVQGVLALGILMLQLVLISTIGSDVLACIAG